MLLTDNFSSNNSSSLVAIHILPSQSSMLNLSVSLPLHVPLLSPSLPTNTNSICPNTHGMTTRFKVGIIKPRLFAFNVHMVPILPKPKTYKKALKVPQWHHAIKLEFETLIQNETWELLSLLVGKIAIGCRWMFPYVEGLDLFEIFSPVVNPITIRVVLTLVVSKGWKLT